MDITQKQLQHQQALQETAAEIAALFDRQIVIQDLSKRQTGPKQEILDTLLKRQQDAELRRKLVQLHPADIAFILESMPYETRERLWEIISESDRGAVLLELSDNVRDSLLGTFSEEEIKQTASHMDASQLAEFLPNLPHAIALDVLTRLDQRERQKIQATLSFPRDSIGALMDMEMMTVRNDMKLSDILELLQKHEEEYENIDQLYVTDKNGLYLGVLEFKKIIFNPPDTAVSEVMKTDALTFFTNDPANEAVSAFERYDLISAPVLNLHNQVVGNISVNKIMDYRDEQYELHQLKSVGLKEEEEVFTPVWKSAKNRWMWLGLNLITAFIASRVIGIFENTIVQLVALATLMPIVASVGGNTGNQTVALMIRALTLNKVNNSNFLNFFSKELSVSMVNGLLWGLTVALFAFLIYNDWMLSMVMLAAMVMNLMLAALAGTIIPYALNYFGRDPVMGSSVLLTAITDSMGFFIFLGMASVFLVAG